MRFIYLTTLTFGLLCSNVFAQEAVDTARAAESAAACEEAITVFHDISGFGRRDRAAEKMTERHNEMALSGWRFASLEAYNENGDLERFFISYTRNVPCGSGRIANR
ncbi:MAG: hypothetical protein ACJ0SL_04560 [Candidatus Rariloculaceae bacterium]